MFGHAGGNAGLAQNIGKADCRKAYADMGVAAAAPLLLDALRDKGCRW